MSKKVIEDLSGVTSAELIFLDVDWVEDLKKKFEISDGYDLKHKIESAIGWYQTLENMTSFPTVKQAEKRFQIIEKQAEMLQQSLSRLSPIESFALTKSVAGQRKLSLSSLEDSLELLLIKLRHTSAENAGIPRTGRKQNNWKTVFLNEIIQGYQEGTGKAARCSWSDYEQMYKGDCVSFCSAVVECT